MTRKSTFLKVMGILCIIFGGLGVILSLLEFSAFAILAAGTGVSFTFAALYDVIYAALMLTAGILGVVNSSKPEKAKLCMAFGIVLIALRIVGIIIVAVLVGKVNDALGGYTSYSLSDFINPFSIITGFAMPVLYTISTFCYKDKPVGPVGPQQMPPQY